MTTPRVVLLAALAIAARQAAGQDSVPGEAAGPLAHWPLRTDARDEALRGRDGRVTGVVFGVPGPHGQAAGAARFDGRRAFVEVAHDRRFELGARGFSVAAWVELAETGDDLPGDIVSKYDPERRRGFVLSITTRAGVTHSQANFRQVHFGIDDGTVEPAWTDRGRPGHAVYVHALCVYDGGLYAGTCEPAKGEAGHVWRHDGGAGWLDCGSPDRSNAVTSLAVFRGRLHAGTGKYRLGGSSLAESENTSLGGAIFEYGGGSRWVESGKLPGAEAVGGMAVFRGSLYATSLYKPAGFYRLESAGTWAACALPAGGRRVEALCPFNGALFASSYDEGHVYRFDGASWTDCGALGDNTQTYGFAVHRGELYASTWPSGRVYRYRTDGDWADAGRLGEELEVMGMAVHNGKLFAGSLPSAAVFRFERDGAWTSTGRVDLTAGVKYRRAWSMAEHGGRLYTGTLPSGRVWSLEAGRSATYDHELAPGWRHVAAVREKDRLTLYIDGKLEAVSTPFDPPGVDVSSQAPIAIGFGPHDYFHGALSDVRVYGRSLGAAEVAGLAKRSGR